MQSIKRSASRRWPLPEELRQRVGELAAQPGPALLEVRIAKGNRADLGRPTLTPQETKRRFMDFLKR